MSSLGDSAVILIPAYNDWSALGLLLPRLDRAFAGSRWRVSVVVIDDGSTDVVPDAWPECNFRAIDALSVLHLRSNLGHQRAIALGLYYTHRFAHADAVVVMDGDGEDRAEDVLPLLDEFDRGDRRQAVFAARTRRMESTAFQVCYHAFRLVHWILTGIEVRVGNFSVLPPSALTRLMAVPEVWNHYAAAMVRSRFPRRLLPLARGKRLEGHSRMNFVGLLIHGLSAMAVFSDQISARSLATAAGLTIVGAILVAWLGWTPLTVILVALAAQSLTFATMFALTIVSRRSATSFVLLRDAEPFIIGTTDYRGKQDLDRLHDTLTLTYGKQA